MSTRVYSRFRCDRCGRRLKIDGYVTSKFTGNRYCFAGHCKDQKRRSRAR